MSPSRITHADLEWWLSTAPTLEWTFARTYAETAPHSYVVVGRTAGLSPQDAVRAARVIHTFGRPAKFYGATNIYLTSRDGQLKWWTMDTDVAETTLINRASTDRQYGVQNAPVTDSSFTTDYDAIATDYDAKHALSDNFIDSVRAGVRSLRGEHLPSILDVGCGTGRVLDLGLTTPDRYAGVDNSQPMLNQLVRKHPDVGAIYPTTVEDAMERRIFTKGQFEIVTVLLGQSDRIGERTLAALRTIASRGLIASSGAEVTVLPSSQADSKRQRESEAGPCRASD